MEGCERGRVRGRWYIFQLVVCMGEMRRERRIERENTSLHYFFLFPLVPDAELGEGVPDDERVGAFLFPPVSRDAPCV